MALPVVSGEGQAEFRFTWRELSGSLGDLGLFLPLVVAMSLACELDLALVLLLAGLVTIVTGLWSRQPLAVQPMKAIAVVVIAEGMSSTELVAAGIGMGVALLLLAGVLDALVRHIPPGVVRGIQLGVGVKLATRGLVELAALPVMGWDSLVTALVVVLLLVGLVLLRQPALLWVFLVGVLLLAVEHPAVLSMLQPALPEIQLRWPTDWQTWQGGLLRGTLPQLPLTLLNSVVAVCALSADYFPGRGVKPRIVALSVGLINLISVPLGGVPVCHGAGGLAAQHRFGARTGGSMIMLGAGKVVVGLLLGAGAVAFLASYPTAVLAPLLVAAGVELGWAVRRVRGDLTALLTALVTAALVLWVSTWIGFLAGLALALCFTWRHKLPWRACAAPPCS